MAKITVLGNTKEYESGTTFETIANEYQEQFDDGIALVKEDGKIRELFKKVSKDADLEFITLKDSIGHKSYARSAIMIMLKAFNDVVGASNVEKIKIEFVIANGYYCSVKGNVKLDAHLMARVKARM